MIRILSNAKDTSPWGAHLMKRKLDNLIDFRSKSTKPLGREGKNALKAVRGTINDTLREAYPNYGKINDKLSKGLGVLEEIQDELPRKLDIYDKRSASAVGQEIRTLFGNREKRQRLSDAFDNIDDVASEFGGKFDDSYKDIYQFTRGIEDVFGKTLKTSFGGEIEGAVGNAIRGQGIMQTGLDILASKTMNKMQAKKARQQTADAYLAMKKIIERDE